MQKISQGQNTYCETYLG